MKYTAPEAKLVELEVSSVVLISTCILDFAEETGDESGDGRLPDFYD